MRRLDIGRRRRNNVRGGGDRLEEISVRCAGDRGLEDLHSSLFCRVNIWRGRWNNGPTPNSQYCARDECRQEQYFQRTTVQRAFVHELRHRVISCDKLGHKRFECRLLSTVQCFRGLCPLSRSLTHGQMSEMHSQAKEPARQDWELNGHWMLRQIGTKFNGQSSNGHVTANTPF